MLIQCDRLCVQLNSHTCFSGARKERIWQAEQAGTLHTRGQVVSTSWLCWRLSNAHRRFHYGRQVSFTEPQGTGARLAVDNNNNNYNNNYNNNNNILMIMMMMIVMMITTMKIITMKIIIIIIIIVVMMMMMITMIILSVLLLPSSSLSSLLCLRKGGLLDRCC